MTDEEYLAMRLAEGQTTHSVPGAVRWRGGLHRPARLLRQVVTILRHGKPGPGEHADTGRRADAG